MVEDITEEIPDTAVIEDEKLPQVYFETNNICVADLPHKRLLNDKNQIGEGLPIAYFSPLQCYLDEACTPTCYVIGNVKDDLCLQHEHFYDSLTFMTFPGHIYNIFDETLFWLMTKHRGKGSIVNEELRWLHWLYHFT